MMTSRFNLKKALSGAGVALKSGHRVSQLTMFHGITSSEDISLVGVSSPYGVGQIFYWLADGTPVDDPEHELVMVDECHEMTKGEVYYSPNLTNDNLYSTNIYGDGDHYEYDQRMKDRGMMHLTKESAIKQAKEILGVE